MNVLAIDPGNVKSGWALVTDGKPCKWGWDENEQVLSLINSWSRIESVQLLIEDVTHMGMAVGRDVFETVRWSGRFDWDQRAIFIPRNDVKMTLCGNVRAKDQNIRQAIIDRYGGDAVAIGGKKCRSCAGKGWKGRGRPVCDECEGSGYETPPGPLNGVSGHIWSALAVAITHKEMSK